MCSVIENRAKSFIFLPTIKVIDKDTSTGVYRIFCDDCSHCYFGETKRELTL